VFFVSVQGSFLWGGRSRSNGKEVQTQEYAVQKFLRQRDEWLKRNFPPTDDATLDKDVAAFALSPTESTVREAKIPECKRQFLMAYRRHQNGSLPVHFNKFCASAEESDSKKESNAGIFIVESEKGLQNAKMAILATLGNMRQTNKSMTNYNFVIAVDDSVSAEVVEKAKAFAASKVSSTSIEVVSAHDIAQTGIHDLAYSKVRRGLVPRPRPQLPEKRDLRLAYTLFVSPNDPPWRIYRIMKLVHNTQDLFFVHVDTLPHYHSDDVEMAEVGRLLAAEVKAVQDLLKPFIQEGNVRVEAVFDVTWGGVSMLNAEIAMAQVVSLLLTLLAFTSTKVQILTPEELRGSQALMSMGDWDYIINLSSSDLPLHPRAKLVEYLKQEYGKQFGWSLRQSAEAVRKRGLTVQVLS
jgi:hypothetical protein